VDYRSINFSQKFSFFQEQWQPKVIAEMNDYQFKIVKLEGDFVWHHHKDTDETFIVIEGTLRIDFRDGAVHVSDGEMFVVPKGSSTNPMQSAKLNCSLSSRAVCPIQGMKGVSGLLNKMSGFDSLLLSGAGIWMGRRSG
jgi:mannose-6-phosphate isomerase-like protein (cupin superfamily)